METIGAVVFLVALNGGLLWVVGRTLLSVDFSEPVTKHLGKFYIKAIPEEIEVTSLVDYGSDASLINFAVPVQRKFCGGHAFRLSNKMSAALKSSGIAQLQSARFGRGYHNTPEEFYYSYAPWQPTPLPSSWDGDSAWTISLGCFASNAPSFDTKAVIEAAREPGAYFTTGRNKHLLAIPRLRLLIVTYTN